MLRIVVLPQPDGPTSGNEFSLLHVERDVMHRGDVRSGIGIEIGLREMAKLEGFHDVTNPQR